MELHKHSEDLQNVADIFFGRLIRMVVVCLNDFVHPVRRKIRMNYRRDGFCYLMEFHVAIVIMNHGNWEPRFAKQLVVHGE